MRQEPAPGVGDERGRWLGGGLGRRDHEAPPLAERLRPYLQQQPPPAASADEPPEKSGPGEQRPPAVPEPRGPDTAGSATAAVFTDEVLLPPRADKPAGGWRRALYGVTAGRVNPGIGKAEQARRELLARVRTSVDGCRRIAVISRKGGVGKTTMTLMLGHTLAAHRGDRVVALDGNPDAGSLGYRVSRETAATVTDLLDGAGEIRRYADVRGYTSQAPTRLEVVASDDDPHISQAIGEQEYREAVRLLEGHYNLILLDTGTGILDSATQGILRVADQLVVVMAPSLDGARAASLTLDWLDQHGYGRLVAGTVAVLNQSRERALVEVERVEQHFRSRCRDMVRIPWDPQLEAGAQTGLDELQVATREAFLVLAAAVADGFAECH